MLIILATWETEIRRLTVPGEPGTKMFERLHFSRKSLAWWHAPVISADRKHITKGLWSSLDQA
jgi:hypothetical protein